MDHDRRQETQRCESQGLCQARQRRHTEITQAVADERFDVPHEPQYGGEHEEAVDPGTCILAWCFEAEAPSRAASRTTSSRR